MVIFDLKQKTKIIENFFNSKYYLEEVLQTQRDEILFTCSNLIKSELGKETTIANFLKVILKDVGEINSINLISNQSKIKSLIQNIENLEIYMKSRATIDDIYSKYIPVIDNLKESFSIYKGHI